MIRKFSFHVLCSLTNDQLNRRIESLKGVIKAYVYVQVQDMTSS